MDEPIPFNQNETGAGGENTVSHTNCAELTKVRAFIIYERGGMGENLKISIFFWIPPQNI